MSQGRKRTSSSRYSQADYDLGRGTESHTLEDDHDGEFKCSEKLREEWKSFKALLRSMPLRTPKKNVEKVKEALQTFTKTGLLLFYYPHGVSVC